ncbi:PREDICTED: uncharacterized protein LOC106101531 [Papilio polytes]|uniref:uncharacterized protein LOC106101531 n=1 Tax=Papilio polytes TaxID=76194 RepID=UPI000676837F|nr:PREDICTED: uncharacterized protein LOC106101531 [Papilio polytes]
MAILSALLLLTVTYSDLVVGTPQMHHVKRSLDNSKHITQTIIKHDIEKMVPIPLHTVVIEPARKQKSQNLPISISIPHQLLVPNLHVIRISNVHQVHGNAHHDGPTVISHTVSHGSPNVTHQLVPVLIPIHNHLVPVHDLTVIPLHSVVHKNTKIGFKITENHVPDESINSYRNPLGGYGAGWYFGGHGAGHGFHYSYG